MSDYTASKGEEENDKIDRGLLQSFLLLRTVVLAVCNMGERVWPTAQVVSEVVKNASREGGCYNLLFSE